MRLSRTRETVSYLLLLTEKLILKLQLLKLIMGLRRLPAEYGFFPLLGAFPPVGLLWAHQKSNRRDCQPNPMLVRPRAIFDRNSELSFEQPSVVATDDCAGSSRTLAIRLNCCSDGRWYDAKLATFLCPDTRATSVIHTGCTELCDCRRSDGVWRVLSRETGFLWQCRHHHWQGIFSEVFLLNQHSSSGHLCCVRDPLIAYWNSRSFLGFSLRRSFLTASTWPGSTIRPAGTAFWSRPDPSWWLLVTYSVESMKSSCPDSDTRQTRSLLRRFNCNSDARRPKW